MPVAAVSGFPFPEPAFRLARNTGEGGGGQEGRRDLSTATAVFVGAWLEWTGGSGAPSPAPIPGTAGNNGSGRRGGRRGAA